jgi:DNA-binding GntR family transcriptional regulator
MVNELKGMTKGPFDRVFGGPVARILDQSIYVGSMEQTIPMLVESTGLSFKTVQRAVGQLNELGLVKRSRRIGNAQTYRFEVKRDMHELIAWAEHFKMKDHRKR